MNGATVSVSRFRCGFLFGSHRGNVSSPRPKASVTGDYRRRRTANRQPTHCANLAGQYLPQIADLRLDSHKMKPLRPELHRNHIISDRYISCMLQKTGCNQAGVCWRVQRISAALLTQWLYQFCKCLWCSQTLNLWFFWQLMDVCNMMTGIFSPCCMWRSLPQLVLFW